MGRDRATRQAGWSVESYTDRRGKSAPVEFIESSPAKERAKVARTLELLQEFGLALGLPHAWPIEGLWELRAGTGRLFYFAHTGRRFIILHGYHKKGRKAPRREIETALRRMALFLEGQQ